MDNLIRSFFEALFDLCSGVVKLAIAGAIILAIPAAVAGVEYLVDEVILAAPSEPQNTLPPTYATRH